MTLYELRIEPKGSMTFEKVKSIIENAFERHGGLSVEGIECLNIDQERSSVWLEHESYKFGVEGSIPSVPTNVVSK